MENSDTVSKHTPIPSGISKLLKPLTRYVIDNTAKHLFKYLPQVRIATVRDRERGSALI